MKNEKYLELSFPLMREERKNMIIIVKILTKKM